MEEARRCSQAMGRRVAALCRALLGGCGSSQPCRLHNRLQVAMSLREFVQALLEFDRLCWGGDAGWMTAQFQ